MAFLGNIKTLSFPELLSLLQQLRKTGVLVVVSDIEERLFLVHRGDIVFATSGHPRRRLGTFLVHQGFMAVEDLRKVRGFVANELYFGERLVRAGHITPEQLHLAVRDQVLDCVEEVISWANGAFHFCEDQLPFAIPGGQRIPTQRILLQVATRSDERAYVNRLFPDANVVLARSPAREPDPGTGSASAVLELVDGRRTVEQVLAAAPGGICSAAHELHDLLAAGSLRQAAVRVGPEESPAVPELPRLPVSPDIPGRLFSAINQESNQVPSLCRLVSQDPLLAAKLLRTVALEGPPFLRSGLSVENIASVLGASRLRSILSTEALRGVFVESVQCYWDELWRHSRLVAGLSRSLARRAGYPYPDEAFLAGLLHNLGVYVLLCKDPEGYRQIVRQSLDESCDLQELEEEHFGVSHSKVGAICAEKWRFPRSLTQVIRHHHRVETEIHNILLHVVSAALGVVRASGSSFEHLVSGDRQFELSLKHLQLTRSTALSALGAPVQQQEALVQT